MRCKKSRNIIIRNGTLITESGKQECDLLVEDGIISDISPEIIKKGVDVFDAIDCYVVPGGIDVHTHMEIPVMGTFSSDSFAEGTKKAISGGTSTIIDFANQEKGKSLSEAYKLWRKKADNHVFCDYGLHLSITDVTTESLHEIDEMIACGVTSFKTFSAYDRMRISSDDLLRVMKKVKEVGGIVTHHAENGDMLNEALGRVVASGDLSVKSHPLAHPVLAEVDAIKTVIRLSKESGCPVYVVHLSSKEGLAEIINAKKNGVKIFAETCPQYLAYNDSVYLVHDFSNLSKFVMSPPLRDGKSQEALWDGVLSGDVDVLATDHCPFTIEQRRVGEKDFRLIPNGMDGVGTRMEYLYNEGVLKRGLSIERYAELTATAPARIFGLYPKKGVLKVGSDADILIIKKNIKFNHKLFYHEKGKYLHRL